MLALQQSTATPLLLVLLPKLCNPVEFSSRNLLLIPGTWYVLYQKQNLPNGKSHGLPYTDGKNIWYLAMAGTESQTSNHLLAEEMHLGVGRALR